MKRGLKQKKSTGRQTLVSKVSYVKRKELAAVCVFPDAGIGVNNYI